MVGRRWSVKQAILQSRSLLSSTEGGAGRILIIEESWKKKGKETRCWRKKKGGGEGRGRHLRGIAIFFKDLERTGLSPLLSRPPGGTGVGRILPPLCTSPPIPSPSKAISIYEWFSSTATRLSTPNPLERLPLAGLPTFLSLCRPLLDGKNRQSAPATTI